MDYIEKLRENLSAMPKDEQDRVVEYYKNIITQAVNPDEMIARLGTPSEVASNVLSEYYEKSTPKKTSKGMIIFIIATSPIWFTMLFVILIVAFSIILTIVVTLITLAFTGIGLLIVSPFLFFSDFGNGLLILGMAFMLLGIVVLILQPVFEFFRKTASNMFASASKIIRR